MVRLLSERRYISKLDVTNYPRYSYLNDRLIATILLLFRNKINRQNERNWVKIEMIVGRIHDFGIGSFVVCIKNRYESEIY